MMNRLVAIVVMAALLAGCTGQKKKEEAQTVSLDEVRAGFVEDAKKADEERKKREAEESREGWAERDLKKDGYDPKTMTGQDIRKMMGAN